MMGCFKTPGREKKARCVTFSPVAHCIVSGLVVEPHPGDRVQWEAAVMERLQRQGPREVEIPEWQHLPVLSISLADVGDTRYELASKELERRLWLAHWNRALNKALWPGPIRSKYERHLHPALIKWAP
jgi:hypothetical protein